MTSYNFLDLELAPLSPLQKQLSEHHHDAFAKYVSLKVSRAKCCEALCATMQTESIANLESAAIASVLWVLSLPRSLYMHRCSETTWMVMISFLKSPPW
jgi:hypothetical protein